MKADVCVVSMCTVTVYTAGTGMHKLNSVVHVAASLTAADSPALANEVMAVCGLSLSSLVNATVMNVGSTTCMTGYYMLSEVCTYCPPGAACATPTSTPQPCAANTYSVGGQRTCTPCPSSCSGVGVCGVKTGACVCSAGFYGYDCSIASSTTTPTPTPTSTSTLCIYTASDVAVPKTARASRRALLRRSSTTTQANKTPHTISAARMSSTSRVSALPASATLLLALLAVAASTLYA